MTMRNLKNVEKSSYMLGSEQWESKFDGLVLWSIF